MPLQINFGQKGISTPRVRSQIYRYTQFDRHFSIGQGDAGVVTIDVEKLLLSAWKHIETKCVAIDGCNAYFKKLPKSQTLADLLKSPFTAHWLVPKTDRRSGAVHTEDELPDANSAGLDFAVSASALLDATRNIEVLAATILHELAHADGASTDPTAKGAMEAEGALRACGLGKFYRDNAGG